MTQEPILNRKAQVRDPELPGGANEIRDALIADVVLQLTQLKENGDRDLGLEFFRTVFKLLATLGVPGTVFQTGKLEELKGTDEVENREPKHFIFAGAYELCDGDEVYYSEIPDGKFTAVVIGKTSKIDEICKESQCQEQTS